jgi:hypothetical protein
MFAHIEYSWFLYTYGYLYCYTERATIKRIAEKFNDEFAYSMKNEVYGLKIGF